LKVSWVSFSNFVLLKAQEMVIVPKRRSVNCLDPGLRCIGLSEGVCEGPQAKPGCTLGPKRLSVETQQHWGKLVLKLLLLIPDVVLESSIH
jgi:hypothetical protein